MGLNAGFCVNENDRYFNRTVTSRWHQATQTNAYLIFRLQVLIVIIIPQIKDDNESGAGLFYVIRHFIIFSMLLALIMLLEKQYYQSLKMLQYGVHQSNKASLFICNSSSPVRVVLCGLQASVCLQWLEVMFLLHLSGRR